MATQPHNLALRDGQYLECWLGDDGFIYTRQFTRPGATGTTTQVTSATGPSNPKLAQLPSGRVILTYHNARALSLAELLTVIDTNWVDPAYVTANYPTGATGTAVYEQYSDDDGLTWNTAQLVNLYGLVPAVAVDAEGNVLRMCYRDIFFPANAHYNSGNPSYCLYRSFQHVGDSTIGSVSPFNIAASPTFPTSIGYFPTTTVTPIFGVTWRQNVSRWVVHSALQPSFSNLFYATDEGATWTVDTAGLFSGAADSGACAGPDGSLYTWTALTTNAYGTFAGQAMGEWYWSPSDTTQFSNPVIRDGTGTFINDGLGAAFGEPFSLTVEQLPSARVIMAMRLFGETAISTWWSGDEGHTFTRF